MCEPDAGCPTRTPQHFIEDPTKGAHVFPAGALPPARRGNPRTERGPPLLIDYLPERQAAEELLQKLRTLRLWRAQGIGPAWTRIGRRIFYSRSALLNWVASNEVKPVRSKPAT
jgi:hypothetical protein